MVTEVFQGEMMALRAESNLFSERLDVSTSPNARFVRSFHLLSPNCLKIAMSVHRRND